MVDYYGRWTAEDDYTNYPAEKMCDCDRLAKRLTEDGYNPYTSVTNVVNMVLLYFDCCDIENEGYERYDENGLNIEECVRYVMETGGWHEFDWEG